jgi:AcrR family transcriptional regulator
VQQSPQAHEPAPADADTSTRERILVATAEVLSRSGTTKLSFSEVALQAGVSRPTLYRWFASKEELLDAFGGWEKQNYGRGMAAATTGLRGMEKLDAALKFIVRYQQSYSGVRMVDIEPGHVIRQLSRVIPVMRERLERLLAGPDGATAAAAAIRIAVSHYLVRSDDDEQFLEQLRHAVGIGHQLSASERKPGSEKPLREASPQVDTVPGFTVYFHARDPQSFDGDHSWKTLEGGALEITKAEGDKFIYSPSYWVSVETGPAAS